MPLGSPDSIQWHSATDLKEEQKLASLVGSDLGHPKVNAKLEQERTQPNTKETLRNMMKSLYIVPNPSTIPVIQKKT